MKLKEESNLACDKFKSRIYQFNLIIQEKQGQYKPFSYLGKSLEVCRQSRHLKEDRDTSNVRYWCVSFLYGDCFIFLTCHGRGCVVANLSKRLAHKAWFGIYARCAVEFFILMAKDSQGSQT